MKRRQTEAIVLNSYLQRERDKLVVFLSPEVGKFRGWVYGARGPKNRMGASLEPLAKVRVHYTEREGDEIVRIESIDLVRSAFGAQQNLRKTVTLSYLAEIADVFAQPEEASELLYRLIDRSIESLMDDVDPFVVVTYVETWILKLSGVLPSVRECIVCGSPLELPLQYGPSFGGFLCEECNVAGSERFANPVSELLQLVLAKSIREIGDLQPSRGDLFELRTFAVRLRREFLQHELKTWDLLQSVL
ncbi:MAG: DNA repair protein RecO [Acidobacteria bacterium]|nr:DNA repair protein RecO [Acidobacteriota bacterium]